MYKCTQCNKEFFFGGQLKRHTLFNHPQAEQPSSLFTELEMQVSSIVEEVPISSSSNRPTVYHNPEPLGCYQGSPSYPTLEDLRNCQSEEDLSAEWYSNTFNPEELTVMGSREVNHSSW